YGKIKAIESLVTEYGTIGALNTAWGSTYTTFWSSQSSFTANTNWPDNNVTPSNCSGYTSWGTGTGIMDEDGSHSWMVNSVTLSGESAAMKADINTIAKAYTDRYFSTLASAAHATAPGVLLEMDIGHWGNPARKEMIQSAATYIDIPMFWMPWICNSGCS